jgi:hypothetical protein
MGGGVHCGMFMKSVVLLVVPLTVLLAGCATEDQTQNAAQKTPYNRPLTSPGAKFGALPPIVQLSVLAEVGPEQVVDAVRDTSSGRVVYKVYFRDSELFPTMYIAPDGSVLNPDLTVAVNARPGTRVKPSEVPPSVKEAIPKRAPAGEVAYIIKESWGGRTVYVVTFKDSTHNPRLLLAEDGTVLDEAQ